MSRSLKGVREFIPVEESVNSTGFLDIVAKFGPLLIAIIAVAFCFYIYKKVLEMNKIPNSILENFVKEQTNTNFQIQESYNCMVEQFNNLSSVVHGSLVQSGTIETQISPSPSIVNETLIKEEEEVAAHEILDNTSELSLTQSGSSKSRRGRKPKNEVNF